MLCAYKHKQFIYFIWLIILTSIESICFLPEFPTLIPELTESLFLISAEMFEVP